MIPECLGSCMEVVPGRGVTSMQCPECYQEIPIVPYVHPDGTSRHMLDRHPPNTPRKLKPWNR
jgi:hypothetical protein